jgi:hypothetical protein
MNSEKEMIFLILRRALRWLFGDFKVGDFPRQTSSFQDELDKQLLPLGFDRVAKRVWVNSSTAPYRKVVRLQAIKGETDTLVWGYSFDFCPTIDNQISKVSWARTPKSAREMLFFDPIDNWRTGWEISASSSAYINHARFNKLLKAALTWFDQVNSLDTILQEFEDWERRGVKIRLGYRNSLLAPLAHAFCLARSGKKEQASVKLSFWAFENKPEPEVSEKLKALLVATTPE